MPLLHYYTSIGPDCEWMPDMSLMEFSLLDVGDGVNILLARAAEFAVDGSPSAVWTMRLQC